MIPDHKTLTTWTFHMVPPLFATVPEYPGTGLNGLFRNVPRVYVLFHNQFLRQIKGMALKTTEKFQVSSV